MNVEIGNEAAQFLFWKYINWIFVAVRQPVTTGATHSCCPLQSFNDNIILCYPQCWVDPDPGSGIRDW